jgi:hypothetical protein
VFRRTSHRSGVAWRLVSNTKFLGLSSAVLIFGAWLTTNSFQRWVAAEQGRLDRFVTLQREAGRDALLALRLRDDRDLVDVFEPTTQQLIEAVNVLVGTSATSAQRKVAQNIVFAPSVYRMSDTALAADYQHAALERLAAAMESLRAANGLYDLDYRISLVGIDSMLIESLKTPGAAIRSRRKALKDLHLKAAMNRPDEGVYSSSWNRQNAEAWLARANATIAEREGIRSELRRFAFVLSKAAESMTDFAQIRINQLGTSAQRVEYAALALLGLGSLLAISVKATELVGSRKQQVLNEQGEAEST